MEELVHAENAPVLGQEGEKIVLYSAGKTLLPNPEILRLVLLLVKTIFHHQVREQTAYHHFCPAIL
jgi:hypothetical protein